MSSEKTGLHIRNLHRNSYDFAELISCVPELKHFVFKNKFGNETINFSIPKAVNLLNKALLAHFYGVKNWSIPDRNLCPPVPGRADYIHYVADLINENDLQTRNFKSIKGLDIGTGASLIYPLIAAKSYGWKMTGTDISEDSLENAEKILSENQDIKDQITLKMQPEKDFIFKNIVLPDDRFAFSMCNPPFYDSEESLLKENIRKNKNLWNIKTAEKHLNFSGVDAELWCEGGELAFISNMILESRDYAENIEWFTCLVSKKEHLFKLQNLLKKVKAAEVKIIDMAQGQKVSRFLAWRFI
ncbi:23S rRNA methyltransferase [Chryseobacterium sp. Leaf180]|uniref:23S rRNA (adenine(1618)-N(6))-methyltransferase RlmF n=1 Tax=Chryseobacterium sp. Leaf180 TaxID=1736289 RepID=UPI0006F5C1D0|nr:23S rRNA (adenine(1618)-N(6))-methyltransferase RlmF [Chryseobacterium sp. Leaf180]KQR94940.1 23S rRNA methyltransferase [Chryseobacterium sp. Leaf180]